MSVVGGEVSLEVPLGGLWEVDDDEMMESGVTGPGDSESSIIVGLIR